MSAFPKAMELVSGIPSRKSARSAPVALRGTPFTAACVAAAQAGLPLTRRNTSRRVQFITGADVSGQLPDNLDLAALADPDATTVVYMGRRTFPALAAQLIARGLASDTPALVGESLGHHDEKMVRTTIGELTRQIDDDGGSKATVILFGALGRGII